MRLADKTPSIAASTGTRFLSAAEQSTAQWAPQWAAAAQRARLARAAWASDMLHLRAAGIRSDVVVFAGFSQSLAACESSSW